MGAFTYIETDTGTNVDISAATAVGAYTSTGDKLIMVDVSIDAVAGNGDYVMYVTRQIGGSGSAYRILPQTTMAAASGLTAISAQSGWITVRNGDVLTCYVDGLAGDTSTPDWSTRWFELAGVTAAAVADAVWDEATADHTTASSFGSLDANVDAILADTGTDGVVLKAAGLNADAVAEIQSGLALEATLTAIKGAGWTNETLAAIDVLIDAIKDKTDQLTFSTPNKVDASADAELSPEAIEEIWKSPIRTLTQSPAEVIATVLGTGITQIRGNSWAVQLTGVVLESTQQFAIKYNATQPDSAALLFVDSVNGLTVLNGVAQDGEDSSKASLTYDGTILTLTVDASITAQLPVGGWQYGIQSVSDNGIVAEPYGGSFRVLADVVRAID